MRFDSPSASNNEAYPEREGLLELPDDLALLADQLGDDAQRLSACYPAPAGPVVEVAAVLAGECRTLRNPGYRRQWMVSTAMGGVVALTLLVLLGLVGENMLDLFQQQKNGPQPVVSGDRAISTDRSVRTPSLTATMGPLPESGAIGSLPGELLTPAEFSATVPSVTPAVFRGGITGPEMEAWMDLRQDELEASGDSLEF